MLTLLISPLSLAVSIHPVHLPWLSWLLGKIHWIGQSPTLILLGAFLVACSWTLRRARQSHRKLEPASELVASPAAEGSTATPPLHTPAQETAGQ